MPDTAIIWLRKDLRLHDNPALLAAINKGLVPIPLYIYDQSSRDHITGAASAWWCHYSLLSLQNSLRQRHSDLLLMSGTPKYVLSEVLKHTGAKYIFWNRCYEAKTIQQDSEIKSYFRQQGINTQSLNASLLKEPWEILKKDDTPYRVFTPFWKRLQQAFTPSTPQTTPEVLPAFPDSARMGEKTVDAFRLLPTIPWDLELKQSWRPGEQGAIESLNNFVTNRLADYPEKRDRPDTDGTSALSAHLHFGEISPVQIWHALQNCLIESQLKISTSAIESFQRQLGWRDFAYYILYHFPATTNDPMDKRFTHFPWENNYREKLQLWKTGKTGVPIIDAGMRQLWTTGWMHNRVRMLVASFLTKNLMIPWQEGAKWFADTLVDADIANNSMGWQWTAGCGVDAAPYFRIFNPVRQGERFDPHGNYVRQWLPELKRLPEKYIHQPWNAPTEILVNANLELDKNYPSPIVNLADSRTHALDAWKNLK